MSPPSPGTAPGWSSPNYQTTKRYQTMNTINTHLDYNDHITNPADLLTDEELQQVLARINAHDPRTLAFAPVAQLIPAGFLDIRTVEYTSNGLALCQYFYNFDTAAPAGKRLEAVGSTAQYLHNIIGDTGMQHRADVMDDGTIRTDNPTTAYLLTLYGMGGKTRQGDAIILESINKAA